LLGSVVRVEDLHLPAKDHSQAEIALASLEEYPAAMQRPVVAQWLKHRELPVVQLGKCNGFCVPVKLLVFFVVGHNGPLFASGPPPPARHQIYVGSHFQQWIG
jgi:hypothetical protein